MKTKPSKTQVYWAKNKRRQRAAFKKKHGMSKYKYNKLQRQKNLAMWEDKERWDAKNLDYYARLCRYYERKGFVS